MIAGYERYYQIARCFRDEATRADRSAEFTQLDLEMAFTTREEVFELMEGLWAAVWRNVLGAEIATPFRRMTWDEAQLRYGSDKPDLRMGCEIADVSEVLRETGFNAFRGVLDGGGVVRGLAVPGREGFSRKDFDDLVEFCRVLGRQGCGLAARRRGRRDRLADRQVPGRAGAGGDRGGGRRRRRATRCSWSPTSGRRRFACSARFACTWGGSWG